MFMAYDQYSISEVDGALLDLEGLMCVSLHNEELRSILTDWENVFAAITAQPDKTVLETSFRKQLTRSVVLIDQMSYERLDVGHADRSYDFLLSIVRKRLEQVRRHRTRDELQNSLVRKGRAMVGADSDVGGARPSVMPEKRVQDLVFEGFVLEWEFMLRFP